MIELDRRRFLQIAGSASLLSAVGGRLGWASTAEFAYIGAENAIHVYSISTGERFHKRQTISSARPVGLAISRGKLYVANGVTQYGNLPRGSVEAYAIDATNGRLELLNRAPLSLSGTSPWELAVARNGRSVVVAVHGGGAYNVLPLDEDGRLGRVSGILKETGSGPHPLQATAHPSAVMFDREGRVLTADQGSDKLTVLALSNGELTVSSRCEVPAGSGPSSMVLHPDGRRVYVAHALNGSISSLAYEAPGILDCKQTVWASATGDVAALAIHPSGEVLYSSHGRELQTWRIADNGGLEPLPGVEGVRASRLYLTGDGESLLALSSDAVLRMKIDAATRIPAAPVKAASLSNPLSIAIV
jgi:6-phosphogluconolactonase